MSEGKREGRRTRNRKGWREPWGGAEEERGEEEEEKKKGGRE